VNIALQNEGNESVKSSENGRDNGEIELVKKASRAFAVCHINEIYETIKSIDPSALKNCEITKSYPYFMYVFIHQENPGMIDRLEIFSEPKPKGDGLCEVKEIYHSSEHDNSILERMKKSLAHKCKTWGWDSLEISKMNTIALCEGIKLGISVYVNSLISSENYNSNEILEDFEIISLAPTNHIKYESNSI
jgi:hypothetical protein